MALFSFFKPTKPKGFNYKPIYYNEQKEEMKEREVRIKRELGLNDPDQLYVPNIKGRFRANSPYRNSRSGRSTVRFLLILFALMLLAYFIFFR
ncbi:MAG: hypothetical protein H6536_01995 [Bacteroidales bacterium]|nr:hypothetical protein [Bacteroidales bacterium]